MNKISKIKTIIMGSLLIIFAFLVISSLIKEFNFNEKSNKDKVYEQIKEYLVENNQVTDKSVENPHTFVEIEQLGIKGSYKKSFVYVWALIKSYYIKDGKLVEAVTTSMPYAFLYEKGHIIKQKIPKSFNEGDLREIFPSSIYNQIAYRKNISETNLNKEVEKYYADILDKQEYSEFIGEWNLKHATIKGEEASLTDLFGTSIQYGGTITLSKIGRYTEFIGAYSSETTEDFQGSYAIEGNKIILTSNSGKTKILNYNKKTKELSNQADKATILYFTKDKVSYQVDPNTYINSN